MENLPGIYSKSRFKDLMEIKEFFFFFFLKKKKKTSFTQS